VGKAEQRELVMRTAVLLTHLCDFSRSCGRRVGAIDIQRKSSARRIEATPSLKATLRDPDWRDDIWRDG
jgi:hypothetical protein